MRALGEQLRASRRYLHMGTALVHPAPAALASLRPVRYSAGFGTILEEKRVVDLLGMNAAVLRLHGIRQLHQAAGGFFRVGIRAIGDVLSFLRAPRAHGCRCRRRRSGAAEAA